MAIKIPGRRSNIALITSSFITISALVVMIVGHLVVIFYAFGKLTDTDALEDLSTFLPMLNTNMLYGLAVLAFVIDIKIFFSIRQDKQKRIKR
ncbi:MAG: hypothetical protein AUK35_09775 [Zetaproteobacteria bacterium CG2_30_46_52]|nr:MAG: hypothetical protein AUK35_09775 [Zetaproteobacteria bacterium CG2_30_46_52]